MLLETNTNISYKETRSSLGNIAVGDFQIIENPKAVANYITKWIDNDCEYDLLY